MNVKVAGLLGGAASVLAILSYLGLQPSNPSQGPGSPTNTVNQAHIVVNVNDGSGGSGKRVDGIVVAPPGMSLNVYASPYLTSSVVDRLVNNQSITIYCTSEGGVATGLSGQSSSLWDKVASGYVPDIALNTGTDQPVAGPCT